MDLQKLAEDAAKYFKTLQEQGIPYDLAERMLLDWHTARIQQGYSTVIVNNFTTTGIPNGALAARR